MGSAKGYLRDHGPMVAMLASQIGHELGLSKAECSELCFAAVLSDMGMVGLAEDAWENPTPVLEPDVRQRVEMHSQRSEERVKGIPHLEELAPLLRHHHEWWDGSGYPDGLQRRGDSSRRAHPAPGGHGRGARREAAAPARRSDRRRSPRSCRRARKGVRAGDRRVLPGAPARGRDPELRSRGVPAHGPEGGGGAPARGGLAALDEPAPDDRRQPHRREGPVHGRALASGGGAERRRGGAARPQRAHPLRRSGPAATCTTSASSPCRCGSSPRRAG